MTNFVLSKRADELKPVAPTFNVVIEPFEPAVNKAMQSIMRMAPNLLLNITKVVVHPGGGPGQLGHVEMGPGKDPREIHIFKDRIKEQVKQQFGSQRTPTFQQLEDAVERAMVEVILHEIHHIGPLKTQQEILKNPFSGEFEAERGVEQVMPRIYPSADDAIFQSAIDLENIREKYLPSHEAINPDLTFIALSVNCNKYQMVKRGLSLLRNKKSASVGTKEEEDFNRKMMKKRQVLKLLGIITHFVGLHKCDTDFVVALAAWQEKSGLNPSGILDRPTVKKFSGLTAFDKDLPRNFGVVVPGTLYRGGMVDGEHHLSALKNSYNIERIISLHNHPDIGRMCQALGIEHIVAPIETGAPDDMGRNILGNNISKILTEKPTYLHCYYGKDRTGGVIARFRTENGWPCDLAYREAKMYGFQDIFVDLIDWFSEFCDHPPVNTSHIRALMGDKSPYINPELTQEQEILEPTPNDMPFSSPFDDTSNSGYTTWNDTLNNITPMSISPPVPTGGVGR